MPKVRLVIKHRNKVVYTLNKGIGENLAKTLKKVRVSANNILTNMIQELEESVAVINTDEEEGSQSDEQDGLSCTPKKRKK